MNEFELTWTVNCLITEIENLKLIIKTLEDKVNNIEKKIV